MTGMRCWTCGGEMVKTVKDVEAAWGSRRLVLKDQEAWVCGNCGDEAYEPDTARRMLELSREGGDAQ